jgi:hypothetical protein
MPRRFCEIALLAIFLAVCGLTIWGVEHYRSVAIAQRDIAKRLIQEEEYRKLVVDELQHRLKNKLSTIHAVLHQVLQDQPRSGPRSMADARAVGDRRSDRQGSTAAVATSRICCSPNSGLTGMSALP